MRTTKEIYTNLYRMSLTLLRTFFMRNTLYFKFFIFLFSVASSTTGFAQKFENEIKEALKSEPRFELRLDSRNSFISTTRVKVFGIKAGVQYDNKLSFGLGYNFLLSGITDFVWVNDQLIEGELKFRMLTPYLEYIFYRDQKWELSIPVQFGLGNSFYENVQPEAPAKFNQQFVISYEPAITFQYRILRYFGVGMGVGYRLMLKPNTEVDEKFTAPVYLFKFKLYFEDLLNDIKSK